jgi:DNA-binding NarL/FixJ family response regulator
LSDFDGANDVAAAYAAGANHYILKPTAVEELKVLFAILYACMCSAKPNFALLEILEEYLPPTHVALRGNQNWQRRQFMASQSY